MTRRVTAVLFMLVWAAAAAPITRERLDLLPGLWPPERRALYARLEGREDVAKALLVEGTDPIVVRCLEALEAGPLLVERYGHALVLAVPDLSEGQRALLEPCVHGVDAAQLALLAHRQRLLKELQKSEDDPFHRRIRESYERQVREMERRFWRIVHLALTTPQGVALRKRYPPQYGAADLQGQVYLLPGLTPSQASRVQALIREFESETAADRAELARLQASGAPTDPASDRIAAALKDVLERGRRIFTEEQAAILDALPPYVTPQDRQRHPSEMIHAMQPRPEQMARLHELGARIKERAEAAHATAKDALSKMEGEIGPEAPQAMTMQMMHAGAQAATVVAIEDAAREAILEVLEPAQVLRWVLTPG